MNCEDNTTQIRATGYTAAYDDVTSSVSAVLISAPRAGVEVMPPVIEPSAFSIGIFSRTLAMKYPTNIGIMVMTIP